VLGAKLILAVVSAVAVTIAARVLKYDALTGLQFGYVPFFPTTGTSYETADCGGSFQRRFLVGIQDGLRDLRCGILRSRAKNSMRRKSSAQTPMSSTICRTSTKEEVWEGRSVWVSTNVV
jgi:hypothetical protein